MKKEIFNRYIITSDAKIYLKKSKKELTPFIDENKKRRSTRIKIHLTVKKGKRKTFNLHKLMIETFVSNYNSKTDDIIFIDNNFKNCSLDNLKVKKNAHIIDLPDEETNKFFNSQDVYGMVKHFIYKYGKRLDLKTCFDKDDLVQHLITYVHRKTPIYLIKYKDKKAYSTFVYQLLNTLYKSQIYKDVNSFGSIITLKQNTFDYEVNKLFISKTEAYQSHIFESAL